MLKHDGPDLAREMWNVDPGQWIICQQADASAGWSRFQSAAEPKRWHRAVMPTRVDENFIRTHRGAIHPSGSRDYLERWSAAICPAMLWKTLVRFDESLTS